MKKTKKSLGFTLIEFLVVIVVVGSIGLVIVGILTSALRGTKKADILNIVRQNGNQALVQMTKDVTYARSFDGVSTKGEKFNVDCMQAQVADPTPTPTPIQYKSLKITASDGKEIVYKCIDDGITDNITSNDEPIIDSNSVKVVPNTCWFTCTKERITSNPIIGIKFQLIQKARSAHVENTASIPFETSVTFKNAIR